MNNARVVKQLLVCTLLLGGVVTFDYLTGYEVTSYPVYLFPIMLAFFYFGKWGGYTTCGIATIMWAVTDVANGHHFSAEIIRGWNALSRCGIYVLFVYGLSVYTKTVSVHRRRVEALQRLIPMCHGCGKIFGTDGIWNRPEDILAIGGGELPECPDCSSAPEKRSGI